MAAVPRSLPTITSAPFAWRKQCVGERELSALRCVAGAAASSQRAKRKESNALGSIRFHALARSSWVQKGILRGRCPHGCALRLSSSSDWMSGTPRDPGTLSPLRQSRSALVPSKPISAGPETTTATPQSPHSLFSSLPVSPAVHLLHRRRLQLPAARSLTCSSTCAALHLQMRYVSPRP